MRARVKVRVIVRVRLRVMATVMVTVRMGARITMLMAVRAWLHLLIMEAVFVEITEKRVILVPHCVKGHTDEVQDETITHNRGDPSQSERKVPILT